MNSVIEKNYQFKLIEKNIVQQVENDVFFLKDSSNNYFKFKVLKALTEKRKREIIQTYEWLAYLGNNIQEPLPSLIKNTENDYFTKLEDYREGLLFNWIDWKIIEGFTVENAFLIGKQLKKIHDTTKSYNGPKDAIRKIDADWITTVAKLSLMNRKMLGEYLSSDEKIKLEERLAWLSKWMTENLSIKDFGLIHSDLHRKNIVQRKTSISFIDFDDTVQSHYLLDIAIILNEFQDYPDKFKQLTEQLLLGYGLETNLQSKETMDVLQKIGGLIYADWIFGERMDKLGVNDKKIEYGIEAIRSVLNIKL